MKFKLLFFVLFLCNCSFVQVYAQYENVWVFGRYIGIDFNSGQPEPIETEMVSVGEGAASVCDASGQLLFYTEGTRVWNRDGNIMPNGDNLTGLTSPFPDQPEVITSSGQGVLIVPMPDSSHKYYVFSLSSYEMEANYGRLYYSVVDMSLQGGKGGVEVNRKGIFLGSGFNEQLTAAVGEDCNVWVVVLSRKNAGTGVEFSSFEVNREGVRNTPVISIVKGTFEVSARAGKFEISPDRKKLISVSFYDFRLFDFNSATGGVSNPIVFNTYASLKFACFSPDNSKLYVSSISSSQGLVQFDISSNNATTIVNSKTILVPRLAGDLKIAPNGKIYFIPDLNSNTKTLGVIHAPNLAGMACNVERDAVKFPFSKPFSYLGGAFPNTVPVIVKEPSFASQNKPAACFAARVTIEPLNLNGWNYEWNDGYTESSREVDISGTYWLTYTTGSPCTFHADTFHVNFGSRLPRLVVEPGCKNLANGKVRVIPFLGDTATYGYHWLDAAGNSLRGPVLSSVGDSFLSTPGTYYLQLSAPDGCDTTLSVNLPQPDYQVSFSIDSLVCAGDNVLFNNTSPGNLWVDYFWDFGDQHTSGLKNPRHAFNHAGNFKVMLVGLTSAACYDTVYQNVIVDAPLEPFLLDSWPGVACVGEPVLISAALKGAVVKDLLWNFGDDSYIRSMDTMLSHAYDQAGDQVMKLTAFPRVCPPLTMHHSLIVGAMPLVNLGPDSLLCLTGASIVLVNHAPSSSNNQRYLWSSGEQEESLLVKSPGRYSLIVTNEVGCATTASVEVYKGCYLDVPNAFTPNGDGINDYFFPRQLLSGNVTQFHMEVFNRWGQIIYKTSNREGRGWDGRFNGADQVGGVYVYQISIILDQGFSEQYEGNVTLLR